MKVLFNICLLFMCFSAQAGNSVKAKVLDTFCGEMDPFAVGDICILNIETTEAKKLAILIDFDQFIMTYNDEELLGKTVMIDIDSLEKIYDRDELEVLIDFDSTYYYMHGSIDSFYTLIPRMFEKQHLQTNKMY